MTSAPEPGIPAPGGKAGRRRQLPERVSGGLSGAWGAVMSESSISALPPGRPSRQPFIHQESLSLDSSCFSSPPVNFLQELPSYRSIARKRTTILSRDKQSGTLLKPTDSYNFQLEGELTEDLDSQSIRKYALNISEKRRLRDIQETQMKYLSEWDQWKRYSSKSWKRFIEKAREMTTHLELWREDIRSIEGKFGTGIQSYFSFLRFLVLLNLVIFLIIFMVVLLPVLLTRYKITNSSFILIPSQDVDIQCTVYPISSSGLIYFYSYVIDLLSGTGFLEDTYLFYGHYTIDGVKFQNFTYDLPLAYLLSTIAYLALSLVWIVKRYSLSYRFVLFELLLMVGVSWRSVDSESHCPKDEKNPRMGFMENKICECAGSCGDLEEMEAAIGSWSSSLEFSVNHY